MMSNNLVDYVRTDEPHDLHHSLFPNLNHKEMQKQWDHLAAMIVVDLQIKVKSHIDTLYIPDMNEPLDASVFPPDLHLHVAKSIDSAVPDWNIAQKSIAFNVYLHELYNQAKTDLFNRIKDKHNRKIEARLMRTGQHIQNIISPPNDDDLG